MVGLFAFLPASAQQQNFAPATTGTGSTVLATSPTITTPTLTSPVLSGATLNVTPPSTASPGVLSTGSITPTATAATIGVATQTFSVTNLSATDLVVVVSMPAPTALCPLVSARATGANTLSLDFAVLTAVACTPAAGTYKILVIR